MGQFETNLIGVYGDKARIWLKELPTQLATLKIEWNLSDLHPAPNLSCNYVLSGFQGNNPIVLKLGIDEKALANEAAALRAFQKFGAVRLIKTKRNALLLE